MCTSSSLLSDSRLHNLHIKNYDNTYCDTALATENYKILIEVVIIGCKRNNGLPSQKQAEHTITNTSVAILESAVALSM